MDGLFGGIGGSDLLIGNSAGDRFLRFAGDTVRDANSNDARLHFVNDDSNWTNIEVEIIDEAFHEMATEGWECRDHPGLIRR